MRTGLARHVAGWVISEGVGMRKPDPLIFQLAAEKVALELTGARMSTVHANENREYLR